MSTLGAPVPAIHAVAATRLGLSFENEEFWFTVLRFIADNPMLDPRQIGPMIDYLHHQKYVGQTIEIAPGIWRDGGAPQPSLSMQGRTVDTLLRRIEAWHTELGRQKALPKGHYEAAPFKGFATDKYSRHGPVRWTIRQLRSADDLYLEGQELNHCVGSYHRSCAEGHCTIWSLSRTLPHNKLERRQTIEVNKSGTIVQCRGQANCDPDADEWSIVNAWAREAGLQISGYL